MSLEGTFMETVGELDYDDDLLRTDEDEEKEESMETQDGSVLTAPTSSTIGMVESAVCMPSQRTPIASTYSVTDDMVRSVEQMPSQQTPVAPTSPMIEEVKESAVRMPSQQTLTAPSPTSGEKGEVVLVNKVCVLSRENICTDSTPSSARVQRFMDEEYAAGTARPPLHQPDSRQHGFATTSLKSEWQAMSLS